MTGMMGHMNWSMMPSMSIDIVVVAVIVLVCILGLEDVLMTTNDSTI